MLLGEREMGRFYGNMGYHTRYNIIYMKDFIYLGTSSAFEDGFSVPGVGVILKIVPSSFLHSSSNLR